MSEKFDKKKYDMDLRKRTKKQFNVDLNIDEKEELDKLLNDANISKVEFLRNAIKDFKEKEEKKAMKNEILEQLNKRLDEFMKENPTQAISSCRKDVLNEFKEKGIITDYNYTTNRTSKSDKVLYFGSCAGFDSMYKVMI